MELVFYQTRRMPSPTRFRPLYAPNAGVEHFLVVPARRSPRPPPTNCSATFAVHSLCARKRAAPRPLNVHVRNLPLLPQIKGRVSFALSPRGPALPVHRNSRAAPALASLAVDASSPEAWRLHG